MQGERTEKRARRRVKFFQDFKEGSTKAESDAKGESARGKGWVGGVGVLKEGSEKGKGKGQ
jgi:hypothetical protein